MRRAARVVTRVALGCFFGFAAIVAVGNILPKPDTTVETPPVYATVDDVYAALTRQLGGATPDFETQVKPTLALHLTYAELQQFVAEGKVAATPTSQIAARSPGASATIAAAAPSAAATAPVGQAAVSITRVDWGPCTTPAKGGLPGWINCPGTVTLQINRPVPSGAVRAFFDWPDTGTFFHGSLQVGSTTGTVKVPVVNTYISHCVTSYGSTVQVYDGALTGPLIARQQLTLTTTCQ